MKTQKYPHHKPGKKNKLRVKDKVKFTDKSALWYVSNMASNWGYGQSSQPGFKEISADDSEDILFWTLAHVSKIRPTGTVVSFGSDDTDPVTNLTIPRKCVRVEFKMPKKVTDLVGKPLIYAHYFSEKDLVKVGKRE